MKHKQAKALSRRKRVKREIRVHRNSFRSKHPDMQMTHPKLLSKEQILAQREPIIENEAPET